MGGYTVRRRKRYWEVIDPEGGLVCLTVYKRGAEEVVRRLASKDMRERVAGATGERQSVLGRT